MATRRALENSMNNGSYFTAQGYSRTIGYSRGLPPLQRQGSHEREITEVEREITLSALKENNGRL